MTRARKKRVDKSGDGPARPGRRPTIREVSRLAGVSHMTVSRVIRDLDLVQPETRARVRKAIADLGYVPDRAAGSLASRRTGFIALMLPDPDEHELRGRGPRPDRRAAPGRLRPA